MKNLQSIPKDLGLTLCNERWALIESCSSETRRIADMETLAKAPRLSFKEIDGETRWALSTNFQTMNVHLLIKHEPYRDWYTVVYEHNGVEKIVVPEGHETSDSSVVFPIVYQVGKVLMRYWEALLLLKLFVPEVTT